ncbi:DUF4384 domain-containing protein [Sulfurimonas sp. SAG-AH-194-I05]|nr:DUF4384 domain-containing protein [Sulfurimonas sp. SAG-AH-194-I05]MDF1874276.1 DUF4384 domain-containing protein [Sulfurimonas sp. SAG-AH-194-I05]
MVSNKMILGLGAMFFLLNGCGGATVQPKIDKAKEKIKAPTVQSTDYESFLRNIGNMYRVYYDPKTPIPFQSKPITNDTGTGGLPVDVSKMVITAVSKIGKPIVYIPYDPNYLINELNTGGAINRVMPRYVISGAITEYDKGIMRQSSGGGVDFFVPFSGGGADGSASKDDSTTASRIVMDFFLIDYATQTMVSGVQSTKTITVYEQSKSKNVGFSIFGSGFGINGSVSRKQGVHAALRLLVELSIAEIISKEAGLPYWKLSKDIKADEATIDKIYFDMDGLSDATKIVLMKEYLTKYGFRINDIQDQTLDAQTAAYYEVLQKDLNLGALGNGYINTTDLVTLHFNLPFKRSDKKYNNSMAKKVTITPAPVVTQRHQTDPIDNLFSNIDKLSSIASSVYVGSIVDANDMYKTPFSEALEEGIKKYIQQNKSLTLNDKPIDIGQKTRSFKKKKKVAITSKQNVVEVVGYVETTENGVEVELQVLSKDAQRLRVIKETFPITAPVEQTAPEVEKIIPQKSYAPQSLDAMLRIAKSDTEMKTDNIFFMTDKGDTHQIYLDGEKIEFALGIREASYAYIFDIDSNLEITTLFDSTTDIASKKLQPEELYTIPSPEADFEIIASAPFGTELIKLVICSEPLHIPEVVKATRSFKKSSKSNTVAPEAFIDNLRAQATKKGALMYEKTILVETRAK